MDEFKFLENLSSCFEKLPSVGKKTASRYAFSVIEKMSEEERCDKIVCSDADNND